MSMEKKVRDFILDNFLFTDDQSAISEDESFLKKGIVDSTGMLEIIYFLEEEFGVKVEDAEMVPENLDSVRNIVTYLEAKRAK